MLQIVKGEKFDYIGDSYSDVPIWESADRKYFVSGNVIFNNNTIKKLLERRIHKEVQNSREAFIKKYTKKKSQPRP